MPHWQNSSASWRLFMHVSWFWASFACKHGPDDVCIADAGPASLSEASLLQQSFQAQSGLPAPQIPALPGAPLENSSKIQRRELLAHNVQKPGVKGTGAAVENIGKVFAVFVGQLVAVFVGGLILVCLPFICYGCFIHYGKGNDKKKDGTTSRPVRNFPPPPMTTQSGLPITPPESPAAAASAERSPRLKFSPVQLAANSTAKVCFCHAEFSQSGSCSEPKDYSVEIGFVTDTGVKNILDEDLLNRRHRMLTSLQAPGRWGSR